MTSIQAPRARTIGRTIGAMRTVAMVSMARTLVDKSGLVVTAVFYIMVTSMLAALWLAATGAGDGTIVGYTGSSLVWYVAASEMATISLRMRFIEELGDTIGSGRIQISMQRPVSVVAISLAAEVGAMLPRLAVCATVGLVLASAVGGWVPNLAALGLAVPALLLAVVLNLVAQHIFAASAFWVRDAKATWFLYQKLVFVVGGMLLPIEVLPGWLETTARMLPFVAMAYVPARLAAGHFEPELLILQLAWLVALYVLMLIVFRVGERRVLEART